MNVSNALHSWPRGKRDSLPLALWRSVEIAAATGGEVGRPFQAAGVETDSRSVKRGDLFVALQGEAMDGHRFIPDAFANGAVAAIVDRPVEFPHVLVRDTKAALNALAHTARERSEAVRIGITGSVGKTGVKEAIFLALDRTSCGAAHRSMRSYNNHVGVPLSLARMPARSRFGVFEMGMNRAGEIAPLSALARPHVALITAIAPAHIERLGSLEAIAREKASIFAGLTPGGTAVIPADSPYCGQMRAIAEDHAAAVVTFGAASDAQVRLLDAIPRPGGGSLVTADLGDRRLCYRIAEPGEHWVANSLGVLAAVEAAGGDLGAAGLALGEMGGLKGRGARHRIAVPGGRALLVDESYNASPASMRATLRQLGQTPATRRIAVLGSMKELGDFSAGFHAQLHEPLIQARVDYVVLVGEEMRALARELAKAEGGSPRVVGGFACCDNPTEAILALDEFGVTQGDAVLVKGSNSVGLGALVSHFTGPTGAQGRDGDWV